MRVPRIYVDQALSSSAEVTLNEPASHYLVKVLRMNEGRDLIAFSGDGDEYLATVSHADRKSCQIKIGAGQTVNRESPLHTHLAIGISRGERMDWVLQKAAELGVTEVTPIFSERNEVKLKGERLTKKTAHWQQVLISACEQCQRNTLPVLNPPTDLHGFLNESVNGLKLVLHHRSARQLHSFSPPTRVTLLIGPEGGLSDSEIALAESCDYFPLTLGPRVLRTETAPLVALTALQLHWGDLS